VSTYDVIIIGGGLAGLTAAIHLRRQDHRVLVLEKEAYPHHKVCGEYLSLEVIPYLTHLGLSLPANVQIDTLEFSTLNGRALRIPLPLGALGISRYTLDYTLYKKAIEMGVEFEFRTVSSVGYKGNSFTVTSTTAQQYGSSYVLGAYGKRSGIDKNLNREFFGKRSPWLGVKAHYDYPAFPENLVGLHSFEGGYAGLSKTETGAVNFCYLVTYKSFQKARDINHFNQTVVSKNPTLSKFLSEASMIFEKPMSIAQISFEAKSAVEDHILMCGDSAGLIHPLCGNGMAMAIHSAKIASELIHHQLKSDGRDRSLLEREYKKQWRKNFGSRIRTGRLLQRLLMSPGLTNTLFSLASSSPGTLRSVVQRTHGKPLEI
jgi:flavin-dependent dehydrogenase